MGVRDVCPARRRVPLRLGGPAGPGQRGLCGRQRVPHPRDQDRLRGLYVLQTPFPRPRKAGLVGPAGWATGLASGGQPRRVQPPLLLLAPRVARSRPGQPRSRPEPLGQGQLHRGLSVFGATPALARRPRRVRPLPRPLRGHPVRPDPGGSCRALWRPAPLCGPLRWQPERRDRGQKVLWRLGAGHIGLLPGLYLRDPDPAQGPGSHQGRPLVRSGRRLHHVLHAFLFQGRATAPGVSDRKSAEAGPRVGMVGL